MNFRIKVRQDPEFRQGQTGFVVYEDRAEQIVLIEPFTVMATLLPRERTSLQRVEPTFFLSQQSTQEIMDQLWAIGIRPTENTEHFS